MNWQRGITHDRAEFTALMHGALEVGRYWHRADGFVPHSKRNNCRPLATEFDARLHILRVHARWLATNLGTTECSTVPCGTSGQLPALEEVLTTDAHELTRIQKKESSGAASHPCASASIRGSKEISGSNDSTKRT